MIRVSFIMLLVVMLHCSICFASSFPYTLNYQGVLTNKSGQPINEPQNITFNLYTTPIGAGQPFWTESLTNVQISNGQLSVTLGAITPLDPAKFSGETYLGLTLGTQAEMLPRQKMTSVVYSFKTIEALNAVNAQTAAFATTATGVVPKGGIIMWSGAIAQIPGGWALCDGTNGTPNLRDRFVVGAGGTYAEAASGGEAAHVLTINEMPVHSHKQVTNAYDWDTAWERFSNHPGAETPAGEADGTANTRNAGGGAAHNNLPPYYALAYIMKL